MSIGFRKQFLLLGVCLSALALGAEGRLGGPVSGFVFDGQSHSIRPMVGLPGSAYLSEAVLSGVDAAAVSPQGDSALVVQQGALALVRGLGSAEQSTLGVEGAIAGAERFAWSADGSSAAIYAAGSGQVQVLRDLQASPRAEAALDVAGLGGSVSALAFDGTAVLLGVASSEAGGVYLAAAGEAPRRLVQASHPAALALSGGNAYVADRDREEILEISDYRGSASVQSFADGRAGISSPVGLLVSKDGRTLLIAGAGSRDVQALEIATRATLARVELDFAPTRFEALGNQSLGLLNTRSENEPLYVLDGSERLSVYFVPAGGNSN